MTKGRKVEEMTLDMAKLWELGKTILVLLVIPGIGWAVKVQINSAVVEQQIGSIQKQCAGDKAILIDRIKKLEGDVRSMRSMSKSITANALILGKLGVQLDATIKTIEELKTILRESRERRWRRRSR